MKNKFWKKVKVSHELVGDYDVNENGEIRKVIDSGFKYYKSSTNSRGYKHIGFMTKEDGRKFVTIHRIVALAFLPSIKGKDIINHKDGNRLNNHFTNLEWVNQSENLQHSKSITHNKRVKDFAEDEIKIIIIDYLTNNVTITSLCDKWNISRESLRTIINNKAKKLLTETEYELLRNKHLAVKTQKKISNKLLKDLEV